MQYYLSNYTKIINSVQNYWDNSGLPILVIEIMEEELQITDAGDCVALKLATA